MNLQTNSILKLTCIVSSLITSVIWIAFFITFFKGIDEINAGDYFLNNVNIILYPLYVIFSIIIVIKANSNRGALLFSLFLSLVSQNIALNYFFVQNPIYNNNFIFTLSFIITSTIYIKSFQNFPQHLDQNDVNKYFPKLKLIRIYLQAFLSNRMWIAFPVIVLALSFTFPGNKFMQSSVFSIVTLTAVFFLYLNYKVSNPSNRNKIAWLFWGVLCYTFLSVFNVILMFTEPEFQQSIAAIINIFRALSLFISITMCLFFFDTFDTGVLIRRTIVDGIIFIVIVLLYNSIEHYFLHWITHKLHISNTLISSILSGFFVLVFSPLHHRFMHVLDRKLKK